MEKMIRTLSLLAPGFLLVLALGLPGESIGHAFVGNPGPDEPPPPPPPPPCKFKTTVSYTVTVIGADGCEKEEKRYRTVCLTTGTAGSVSYRTGAETVRREDMLVNGVYPIQMMRQYMSDSYYDSSLGYGWSFNHDLRLFEYSDQSVIVRTGCGVNYRFVYTGGTYQTEVGSDVLTKNPDGTFDLVYLNGRRDHFDSQGRLIEAWDNKSNRLEYLYDSAKTPLIGSSPRAVDPAKPISVAYVFRLNQIRERLADGTLSGNFVNLSYNTTTGRLNSITSNDGRTVSYVHDDAGGGLTKGNLIQANALDGVVSTYKYEDIDTTTLEYKDHHNITEIKHSAGSTPIILEYDILPNDRVIKEVIGFQEFTFDWSQTPLRTKVTEKITDDQGLNPVFAVREYAYDINDYMNEFIDAFGNKVTYLNDAMGNTIQEDYFQNTGTLAVPVYALQRSIVRTYSAGGLKESESITLDSGEIITYSWTHDGTRIASKENSSSLAPTKIFKTQTIFNHDGLGKPTTIQAERRYKDNGVDYLETGYTYNNNGDVLTTTLPDGHVIENEYGTAYGGLYVTHMFHRSSINTPMVDLEEFYEYDNKGNRTQVTDARGNTTITVYDDKNRRKTVTNAKGHVTNFVYDANDNLTQIKRDRTTAGDQLDITRLTYDGKNQLTQIERTDDTALFVLRASMRYDSTGNVIARGDAFGVETTLSYDLENRLTRITDAQGNYIQYTLNALGQRIATGYFTSTDTQVRTATAVFDDLDRQQQTIGALGQITSFSYDAEGNRITAIDALSRPTTVYTYDTLSRLTNVLDANSKNTIYQYDDRDQLRYVTDPRGLITEYQYSVLGQLRFLISPDTGTTEYTYDLAGNQKTQKDARNITATFNYDQLNRIVTKTYPDSSLSVIYDYDSTINGIGKLANMFDSQGQTSYEYDVWGNVIKQTRTTNGQVYVTEYGYDANDRLIKITYPSSRTVDYVRNNLGQVTTVTTTPSGGSAQTIASSMSYLPFGALEDVTYGNSLLLDQSYDQDYRLTDQVTGVIYSRTYTYDAVNNIKDIIDNTVAAKTQNFNYDVLDRLDDATSTPVYGALDYVYDDVGNRISLTVDSGVPTVYNYDLAANQLDNTTGTQTNSFTYDLNGNTKTKNAFTFTYNDMNRMSQVNDGVTTTTYAYNGQGERVKKVGSSTTLYHYDETGNLLYETDTAGNTLVEYVWLGSQRLAMIDAAGTYYTHSDHLGTAQLLTDGAGLVVWKADYDPFGEATITVATVDYNMRFPGQYYDQESGLHYNYFRDYDPGMGRYVESDPIGQALVFNSMELGAVTYNKPSLDFDYLFGDRLNHLYEYGLSSPIKNIDTFGLSACSDQCALEYSACLVIVSAYTVIGGIVCTAVCPTCAILCAVGAGAIGLSHSYNCTLKNGSCLKTCPCD